MFHVKHCTYNFGVRRRVAHPSPRSVFLSHNEPWVPHPCVFARVGRDAADSIRLVMPRGLHRYYGAHHLHFITGNPGTNGTFPNPSATTG
jgi:hypothetical protein